MLMRLSACAQPLNNFIMPKSLLIPALTFALFVTSSCSPQERAPTESVLSPDEKEQQLTLPVAEGKLVIAHNMVMIVPGIRRSLTLEHFRPDGTYAGIGGLSLVLPLGAMSEADIPEGSLVERLRAGDCDALLAREMLAAKELGVDGFQFYFPSYGPENANWQRELPQFIETICRYFIVAEERGLDFKLTLCLSHPRIEGDTETRARVLAKQIHLVLDRVGDSPNWLRTPDGRLLFFTFAPETLAASVSKPPDMVSDPAQMESKVADVARAYELLAQDLAVPQGVAFLYHLRNWYFVEFISSRNNMSVAFDYYEQYVNLVLDNFPAVYGWLDLDTESDDRCWEYVADTCLLRDRTYIQYVFNEMNMSKVWSVDENRRVKDAADLTASEDFKRYNIGSGLSENWRKLWQRAIDYDVPMVALATWNDYEEGHHLGPEVNHNFGFAVVMDYYKRIWREEDLPTEEWAAVFFKKHLSTVGGSHFDVHIAHPVWMLSETDWERLLREDDKIEIVTMLTAPAEVWLRGEKVADVETGLQAVDLPLTPGPVNVDIRRDGQTILSLRPPEWVTDAPYRTDRTTYAWSSEHDRLVKAIYGDEPTQVLSEYAETDGVPNWKRIYFFDTTTDDEAGAGTGADSTDQAVRRTQP